VAVRLASRPAAAGAVPVYAAIGVGMRDAVEDLFLLTGLTRAGTPRAAAVLLVAGALRDEDAQPLRLLHDQLPHPRGTFWWRAVPPPGFAHSTVAEQADAQTVVHRVIEQHTRLLQQPATSEADCLPDEPPAPWRGLGQHGQGGEGMMGGRPYGRAMAMTEEDLRDGLQLDAFRLRLGPFAPMLPPGLVLELVLQGDVIQQAQVRQIPFAQPQPSTPRSFLRRAARMLELLELFALAERCRRRAGQAAGPDLSLLRAVRWSGALAAVPRDLGRVESLGTDARERLQGWLTGNGGTGTDMAVHLDQLLPGLEWQEAMLAIASLDGVPFAHAPADERTSGEQAMAAGAHAMLEHAQHAQHTHGGPG
jgi:hypothetical protein